uniref:Uncharacterized protein n=1 Tax=Arundo donax TaxID=35708 RepID=A0A0A9FNH0_ARUDO
MQPCRPAFNLSSLITTGYYTPPPVPKCTTGYYYNKSTLHRIYCSQTSLHASKLFSREQK